MCSSRRSTLRSLQRNNGPLGGWTHCRPLCRTLICRSRTSTTLYIESSHVAYRDIQYTYCTVQCSVFDTQSSESNSHKLQVVFASGDMFSTWHWHNITVYDICAQVCTRHVYCSHCGSHFEVSIARQRRSGRAVRAKADAVGRTSTLARATRAPLPMFRRELLTRHQWPAADCTHLLADRLRGHSHSYTRN